MNCCNEGVCFNSQDLIELIRATFDKGADFRFRAKGFSMSPFIRDGDVLVLSRAKPDSFGIGNVAAFINIDNQKLVVHRIVGRSGDGYILKGDNINSFDGCVPPENILGLVSKVERKGRIVSFGLGKERLAIAFLSRMVFFFPCLKFIWRNLRKFVKIIKIPVFKTEKD